MTGTGGNIDSRTAEWDVAFSLQSEDLAYAQAIEGRLPDSLEVFLYEDESHVLGGRDATEVFPRIFRSATLCVVLYSEGWGQTKYTRLEEETLKDRRLEEGLEFLFLVRLDDSPIPEWFPTRMQWVRYHDEGPAGVAQTIVSDFREIRRGGRQFRRAPKRSAFADPVPKSVYQRHQGGLSTEVTIPVSYETCDACSGAVRFRPLTRVTLWGGDEGITTEERLCPPCAREREITVHRPPGMDDETLYAPTNPSVKEHVDRLLARRVLAILSEDEELHGRGVEKVGASIGGQGSFNLTPSGPVKPEELAYIPWTKVTYRELEEAGALTDVEMSRYLKDRLFQFLDERGW